jgi:hypothetical protein
MLILTVFSYGQIIWQNSDAKLFFNDGTSIKGYGMMYKTDKIKFRISLDDEPDIWTDLMVKGINFYGFEMSSKYAYIKLKPNEPATLLKVPVGEETKLYSYEITKSFYSNNGLSGSMGGIPTSIYHHKNTTTKLYVQKKMMSLL